ncbi:response regulator transcription factor [Rhizobium leguminosarum]|uniref:response regulator transcription factor n=1 Tax=Rhizobium leguminosarum TaxID=384 RepID=UPI00103D2812|nr:response regulator [Rhizobium leguminosarum]TCA92789.1 response regulator [Rhizobium leguminosarum bv. viciae]
MNSPPIIAIIDDNQSVRESMTDLLEVLGFSPTSYASAFDFLASPSLAHTDCLLLDLSMPGMNGVELNAELSRRSFAMPVVFMTGHAQEAIISEAKSAGTCLFKPFGGEELKAAIEFAIKK